MEAFSCSCEVQFLGQNHKAAQMSQLHPQDSLTVTIICANSRGQGWFGCWLL